MLHRASIPLLLVAWASSAQADTLVLLNGDTLTGEIIEWAVDHVVLEHEQLGTIRLSLEQLKLDTGKPPSKGLFDTRILRGWDRRITAGWTGEAGESMTIRAGLRFQYKDEFKRWDMNGRYFFNKDDEDNDNNGRLDLSRDWLRPNSRLFLRVGGRYQFDQTEEWEHRTTFAVAPGLHVLDTESHDLDFYLGPVYSREFGKRDDNIFQSLVGFDYDWQITKDLKLDLTNNFFTEHAPDANDIRNLTIAELSFQLTEKPDLSLNLQLENEWEVEDDDGVSNTLNYGVSLGLGF